MKRVIMPVQQAQCGRLVLVNDKHGLNGVSGRFLELEDIGASPWGESVLLESEAAAWLNKLMEAIDGWKYIVPVSGYRSQAQQQKIWDDSVVDSGLEFTEKYVAVPGHSEHQTGLAIDLGLRQDKVGEAVTHIGHEPWHFRYVGVEHAKAIAERKITLEEYIEWLRKTTGKEEGYVTEAKKRRA